jgi:hypothetical protein
MSPLENLIEKVKAGRTTTNKNFQLLLFFQRRRKNSPLRHTVFFFQKTKEMILCH